MVSGLVCLPLGRVAGVRSLAGDLCVFLGKTLYFHIASLHPGIKKVPTNLILGVTLQWTNILIQGERQTGLFS